MIPSHIKLFILDVDGVIVNSTEECLVVAWNAYQKMTNGSHFILKTADVPASFRDHFKAIRLYVRSMEEYLLVFKYPNILLKTQQQYEELLCSMDKKEMDDFGKLFFQERVSLKQQSPDKWFNLHTVYPNIKKTVLLIQKLFTLYIVSGKDKGSIEDIFHSLDITIPKNTIFEKKADDKYKIINKLARTHKISLIDTCFLDDNISHLLTPHQNGVTTLLANWGYVTEDHKKIAKEHNVPCISSANLYNQLLMLAKEIKGYN
jgi:phosphoglycolate phosphatase-like HAD superfamily hydrolase